jgi:hypothetical protein
MKKVKVVGFIDPRVLRLRINQGRRATNTNNNKPLTYTIESILANMQIIGR